MGALQTMSDDETIAQSLEYEQRLAFHVNLMKYNCVAYNLYITTNKPFQLTDLVHNNFRNGSKMLGRQHRDFNFKKADIIF